jgi:hypothetical protein
VSPAGAQGIAQFMPETAAHRGLRNPFDPREALPKAAELLSDLKERFGNLGLAAAAYNAGPRRIEEWLRGNVILPSETAAYVRITTGKSPAAWITLGGPLQKYAYRLAGQGWRGPVSGGQQKNWERQLLQKLLNPRKPTSSGANEVMSDRAMRPLPSATRLHKRLCPNCIVLAVY